MSNLYERIVHRHRPVNINEIHDQEQQDINSRIAVFLTKTIGSMWMAYAFICLALIGLFAILGISTPIIALIIAWLSQTFIQLVLLPVIMVGQNVLNRKQELQADELFETSKHSFHDIEQIMNHLDAQDEKILEISNIVEAFKK
jgi:uncharacterized membrane protein